MHFSFNLSQRITLTRTWLYIKLSKRILFCVELRHTTINNVTTKITRGIRTKVFNLLRRTLTLTPKKTTTKKGREEREIHMKGINQATNPCIQSPSDHPQEKDIQRETITITGARDQCEDHPSENDPNISISSSQCCGSGSILRIRIWI